MKQLSFDNDAKEGLAKGVELIAKAVGSTLGPLGNTVIIEDRNTTRGIKVTKDGVTVAKSVSVDDPVMDSAIQIVKEAAERTGNSAGDGTTTSIVLANALVSEGFKVIKNNPALNISKLMRELKGHVDTIVSTLEDFSIPVTEENITNVATISANNDAITGALVAKVFNEVGDGGRVTPEMSKTERTYYEVTNGIKVSRGWSSNMFVNNQRSEECVYDDVHVLMTDSEIISILDIEKILKPIIQKKEPLLIIGRLSENMRQTLIANNIKNGLKFCHMEPPSHGYRSQDLMSDIALALGGKYYSESAGDNLNMIEMGDLGKAKKIVIGRNSAVIIPDSKNDAVDARLAQLSETYETEDRVSEKKFLKERIANLSGGVGVIYVGGDSETERKELFDRIEDAVLAVDSAKSMGILPGGGIALAALSENEFDSNKIINKALRAPLDRIFRNGDLEPPSLQHDDEGYVVWGYGWDLANNKHGDMIDLGVIDPTKVTVEALKNAFSVASTILTTKTVINYASSR